MSQASINFRIDGELKKEMEETCKKLGLTLTSAFTIFTAKVVNEQRIPFEISIDPFYSDENMKRINRSVKQLESGNGIVHEVEDYEENLV